MTQMKTRTLTAFVIGLLLGLLAAAGISQLSGAMTSQPAPAPVTELTPAAHQVKLPSQHFLDLVYGEGTEYDLAQAERLGSLAEDVCGSLWDGAPYLELRDAVAETEGWTPGEAGLFVSAAQITECARTVPALGTDAP